MDKNDTRPARIAVRKAQPYDVPALMRLKRLLAQSEDALHAVRATEADWLRDGFGPNAGFTAFVAECNHDRAVNAGDSIVGGSIVGSSIVGSSIVGMATCSRRLITGWNGPVIFLQDLYVDVEYRAQGVARLLMSRVAALARDLGSPIIELTVHADNPAQKFYLSTGFQPLPQCLTFVLSGAALAKLADGDEQDLALTG
jgi:GNAT superfamily N-acetyltransferase